MISDLEGKKLLILGGTKTECDIVRCAQAKGIYTIVADYDASSPAMKVADKAVLISARDIDALVRFCRKEKVDGVTTGFVDILLRPCVEVCKRLGLPCYITEKMLSMSTNKVDFKNTCIKYDVPVPQTYLMSDCIDEVTLNKLTYPVFVKPLDASGSRGAGVCNNKSELAKQFSEALSYSDSGKAIIEEYITGTEFLLDYVGVNGEFRLLSMFDRYMSPDRGSAINYSNACFAPSKAVDDYYKYINPKVLHMFKEIGFTDGLIFLQGHSNGDKITFYEMGCRLGGSFFNLEQAVLDLNPVEMTIRYALTGKMCNSIEDISTRSADFKKVAMVCNFLLVGENETVATIEGVEEVKAMNSFVALIQQRDIGFRYGKDKSVDKPILSFFMISDNINQAKEDLKYINEKIQVKNLSGKSLLSEKFNPNNL